MATAQKTSATNARSFRTFLLMQQFQAQEIGARISQARREADGMTQETLGDLIGVSTRSIQDYEAGATIPWKKMREIAKVLGKEVDWFMRGSEEPPEAGASERDADLLDEIRQVRALVELLIDQRRPPDEQAPHANHSS